MKIETNSLKVRDFLLTQKIDVNFDPFGEDFKLQLSSEEMDKFFTFIETSTGKMLMKFLQLGIK